MKILAIDTSASLCAACLYDTSAEKVLGRAVHDIGRGHAEKLLSVIDEALTEADLTFEDIDRVAVSVGPGSFTGIRVGVAAARGFGLALEKKVVGVTTFDAMAFDYIHTEHPKNPFAITLSGGRGQVFAQGFDNAGQALGSPFVLKGEDEALVIGQKFETLIGNAASTVDVLRAVSVFDCATGSIEGVAALGAHSALEPKPLYLRAADAKVAEGFALPRKAEIVS